MAEENVMTDSIEHEVVIKAPVAVSWPSSRSRSTSHSGMPSTAQSSSCARVGALPFAGESTATTRGRWKAWAATPVCVPFRRPCP